MLNVTCFACLGGKELLFIVESLFLLAKSLCGVCVDQRKNVQCTFQIHCEHIISVSFIYKYFLRMNFPRFLFLRRVFPWSI